MENHNLIKINVHNPLTIEEQLIERAKDGKCVMGWWDDKGQFISWMPGNLTYYEKLFIIDSLQRRMTWELNQGTADGDDN